VFIENDGMSGEIMEFDNLEDAVFQADGDIDDRNIGSEIEFRGV